MSQGDSTAAHLCCVSMCDANNVLCGQSLKGFQRGDRSPVRTCTLCNHFQRLYPGTCEQIGAVGRLAAVDGSGIRQNCASRLPAFPRGLRTNTEGQEVKVGMGS